MRRKDIRECANVVFFLDILEAPQGAGDGLFKQIPPGRRGLQLLGGFTGRVDDPKIWKLMVRYKFLKLYIMTRQGLEKKLTNQQWSFVSSSRSLLLQAGKYNDKLQGTVSSRFVVFTVAFRKNLPCAHAYVSRFKCNTSEMFCGRSAIGALLLLQIR